MPYSRKSLVLSQLKEIAKNDNRPHPPSRGTVSIPQERIPTINPVSHRDLLVVSPTQINLTERHMNPVDTTGIGQQLFPTGGLGSRFVAVGRSIHDDASA
jgi:hypothetical protein